MATQSEQIFEDNLVAQLIKQGYQRANVSDEASILANLKSQFEAFNGISLTDGEFAKVLKHLTEALESSPKQKSCGTA